MEVREAWPYACSRADRRGASWIVPPEVIGIPLSWNFLPLKDDARIVFHDWVEGDGLGDLRLSLALSLFSTPWWSAHALRVG
ncbi:unnamed protein product [Prunus armeniaca]